MTSKLDFSARLAECRPAARRSGQVTELMLNIGRRCDVACSHCHHRCSPTANEEMSSSVMEDSLALAAALDVALIDVTGGAPELWPLLPAFVARAAEQNVAVRVRTNLVLLARPQHAHLVPLLAAGRVTLLASVPQSGPDGESDLRPERAKSRQKALLLLAEAGYGMRGGAVLELAVNPERGLPRPEEELASSLLSAMEPFGITATRVRSIANAPLGRFGDRLDAHGERSAYLHSLADAFDERSLECLPCRSGVTVAWDGGLYDCDFNLSAGLGLGAGIATVSDALADPGALNDRAIAFGPHCFACTVGAGSG